MKDLAISTWKALRSGILETTWKQARNETFKVHEILTNKKSQRLYASNDTIIKLWLATTNKVWKFYVHSKPWKERMKDNSKPHHYILFPTPKVAAT
jgi:hypothetical protein